MTLCTCMRCASHHLLFFSIHILIQSIIIYPYTFFLHLGIKGCIVLRATHTILDINISAIILCKEKDTKILSGVVAMNPICCYF